MPDEEPQYGAFKPEGYTKTGCPTCYGHFISGRMCDCTFSDSCREYTFSNKAMRKRDVHYRDFAWVSIDDRQCAADISRTPDPNGHPEEEGDAGGFELPDGRRIDPASIDMGIIKMVVWMAIENPSAMKALMCRLDPSVRCLQDIASVFGVSKQAVQKRIACELGIGKRSIREPAILGLSGNELAVYRLVFARGMSIRMAAEEAGLSPSAVLSIKRRLERMGLSAQRPT